jgi:hypothetical protein
MTGSLRAHATLLAICAAFTLAACHGNRCDPGQELVNPACRVSDAGGSGSDAGTAGTDVFTLPLDGQATLDVASDAAGADVPAIDGDAS